MLVIVLFVLWSKPDRQTRSTEKRTENVEAKPLEASKDKPAPAAPRRSTPLYPRSQTEPVQNQPSEPASEQDQTVELTRPKADGPIKLLKRVYEDESRDATAKKTEKLIRDEFGTEYLPADTLHNVTCHKSVCKVDAYWTEKNPLVLMALAMKVGHKLTGYIAFDPEPEPDRDGRVLVSVYFLRAGYELSDFE